MKLRVAGTVNYAKDVIYRKQNVEHRTPNIEHPILMALRLIYSLTSELQNQPEADKFRGVDSLCSAFY
jgi:energy-coupling factor transporter transmembrane protein EcfT